MSRFLELLINPLSHEEPVASQNCGQLRGFIPICDITGNELRILSVYHSSNLIAFGAANGRFGSLAALFIHSSPTAAFGRKADTRQRDFEIPRLNVCFSRKRTFRLGINRSFHGRGSTATHGQDQDNLNWLPPFHDFPPLSNTPYRHHFSGFKGQFLSCSEVAYLDFSPGKSAKK